MLLHSGEDAESFRAYRETFQRERMPAHVRVGAAIAFVINSGFALLDYAAYPESWHRFFFLRVALDALFVIAYLRTADRHPGRSQIAICLALGAAMLMMIFSTGGAMSDYYAGLILLFVAMGVVFPLSALEALSICGPLTAVYALSPLLTDADVFWPRYWIHLVFLVGASVESIVSCAFLDRMRFTDYNQRKRILEANEHLQEMDRLKSRFTANVHHELRTPLTLILAPIESLLAGEFGPIERIQRDYLETARRNALRLLRLINELLEFARIEGQQRALRRSALDVRQLAREVAENARPLAATRSIEIDVALSDETPTIHADRDGLEKVLVNLVGNALKFTDPGGRVTLEVDPVEAGAEIRVRDTGIGIPPDKLDRVFDRFAQLDSSNTRRHEGSGIGLALCREIVGLHGGTIEARSDGPGRGTTMLVRLPVGTAEDEQDGDAAALVEDAGRSNPLRGRDALSAAAGLDARRDPGPDAGGADAHAHEVAPRAPEDAPEVLVVEDNAEMRRLVAHHVGREFRVRVAENGRVALAAVTERPPDLVLTDVMMPEMSGTELCRRLKADPATRAIPVVLLTSKADREHKIQGLELGAEDYVQKPFHPRELLARIRSLTRLHQLQREVTDRNRRLEETNAELEATMRELRETEVQLIAQERLAAVGELAAGIAHEVNNPVNFACNAVRTLQRHVKEIQRVASMLSQIDLDGDLPNQVGALQLLQEEVGFEDLTSSLDELGRIASEGLDRTARLVGDFRDFARPRPNAHGLIGLRKVLESSLLLVSHKLKESGISVELALGDAMAHVPGDARALSQVFLNLFKNAIDAFDGRAGTIRIELSQAGDCVQLDFVDDGPGIEPGIRETLFEPFASTRESASNSGLGLSICRRIVTQHGGTIEALDRDGGGTCIRVTLPRNADDDGDELDRRPAA